MILGDLERVQSPRGKEQRLLPMGPDRRHRRWKRKLGAISAFGNPSNEVGPPFVAPLDAIVPPRTDQS